jgi:hypothetical protein
MDDESQRVITGSNGLENEIFLSVSVAGIPSLSLSLSPVGAKKKSMIQPLVGFTMGFNAIPISYKVQGRESGEWVQFRERRAVLLLSE